MGVLQLKSADILRSKLVTPGWQPIEVVKVSFEPAKSDGGASMNHVLDHEISEGEFAGVPLRDWISEKAAGTGMAYLKGCGFKIPDKGGDFNLDQTIGKKLMAHVETKEFGGRFMNTVTDYRPRG